MKLYDYCFRKHAKVVDSAGRAALPEPAITVLSPYFPRLDLHEVTIQQGIPGWVKKGACINVAAVAISDTLYFAPGQYDPDSPMGLARIGHELVHVQQQRDAGGFLLFCIPYLSGWAYNWMRLRDGELAYQAIRAEGEARAMEDRIRGDLEGSSEDGHA